MAGDVLLRMPPAFAGGRLRWWNLALRGMAQAHAAGGRLVLELDDALLREADRRLPVQNAHGDVVRLPLPEGECFRDARARDAYRDALEDLLPPTAELHAVVDAVLPAPDAAPAEAAVALWSMLFPEAEVRVRSTAGPGAATGEAAPTETGADETTAATGWTWVGAHHRKALAELGLEAEAVLAGEAALIEAAGIPLRGALGEEVEALREEVDRRCRALAAPTEEAGEQLLGALRRMRRDLRGAIRAFAQSADRAGRNRSALRGTRLHQLAQGLRPLDLPQEEGLSLLAAAALFQLDYRDPARYLTSLPTGGGAESLLLDC